MLVIVSVSTIEVVPVVTEPKDTGEGAATRVTTAAIPVPERASEPLAFPATFKDAARPPAPAGVKVNLMVQEAPGPRIMLFTHVPVPVLVTSAAFVPLNVK